MRGMAESDRDRMGWTIADVKRTSGAKGSYRKASSNGSKAKSSLHTAAKSGDVVEIRALFAVSPPYYLPTHPIPTSCIPPSPWTGKEGLCVCVCVCVHIYIHILKE